jgi:hypothetical protein
MRGFFFVLCIIEIIGSVIYVGYNSILFIGTFLPARRKKPGKE